MSIIASDGFQLSPQQKHLWSLQGTNPHSPFRVHCLVQIRGSLNRQILRDQIERFGCRYEILGACFQQLPGLEYPLQVNSPNSITRLEEIDLSDLSQATQTVRLEALEQRMKELPFDFENGRVANAWLVKISASLHLLMIRMSALCGDGPSLKILVEELARGYSAALRGEEQPDEPMQYSTISEWFNEVLEWEEAEAGREHWRKQDLSALSDLRLPFENREIKEFAPLQTVLTLDMNTWRWSERLASKYGVTTASLFLTCWQILLSRLTGQINMVVGAQFEGRTDEELQGALGLIARYLPICCQLDADLRFGEALHRVDKSMQEAAEWQDCFSWERAAVTAEPREQIQRNTGTPGPHLFFPFLFDFQEQTTTAGAAGDLIFSFAEEYACLDRFNLRLSIIQRNDSLLLELHFNSALFELSEIEHLASQFLALLGDALENSESEIGALEIMSSREREAVLLDFNRTGKKFDPCNGLHHLFQKQAARSPDAVALVFEDGQLTYRELNARANQLSHYLRKLGAGPEMIVGVCVERSLEMVICLLGILKTGAAYVPLDPAYPSKRLLFIAGDVRASLVLAQQHLSHLLSGSHAKIVCVDTNWDEIGRESEADPTATNCPANLAYVMYTSGSTGQPKGVMISHEAICNRLLWMQSEFPIGPEDCVLQKTVFSFDASVWELFMPLLTGARLVMARPRGHQDPSYLVETIVEHNVTTLQLVPSMLRLFLEVEGLEQCHTLRRVFCGGEKLPVDLQERFFASLPAALHNLYGPTEASIDATCHTCERQTIYRSVPIGRPIANMQVYLLDKYLKPVPQGVPGELYLSGTGLARGYLQHPEITAERFMPNPFSSDPGARLYRTGDLARRLPNAELEVLGRVDEQVKVRGHRIELGEIEATLRQHPFVSDAVVLIDEEFPSAARLVAYIVPEGEHFPAQHLYRLPNDLEIAHQNKSETDLLYQEIFAERAYLRHGVTLNDGDCVFDVGANIGLFTLFAHSTCQDLQTYSFEPAPQTFQALQTNVDLYKLDAKVFECGLSNRAGTATFTFYPRVSASSGMYADAEADEQVTRAFISNQDEVLSEHADTLLEKRFTGESFVARIKTLSEIISENEIEKIDLLKLDVEKSELDVLAGILEADWPKIKQLVMEVRDIEGRLQVITELLEQHGHHVVVDQQPAFQNTGLYHIYAIHPSRIKEVTLKPVTLAGQLPRPLNKQVFSLSDLQRFLKDNLPEYMVPASFLTLDAMPLLPNGKVDRQALKASESVAAQVGSLFVAPRSELEREIAAIWQEILRVDEVGINDNFFDLGGHSLLVAYACNSLRERLHREVSMVSMFEHPTISALAKFLDDESDLKPPDDVMERAKKQRGAMQRQRQILKGRGIGS